MRIPGFQNADGPFLPNEVSFVPRMPATAGAPVLPAAGGDDATISGNRAVSLGLDENWRGVAQADPELSMAGEDRDLLQELKQARPDLGVKELFTPVTIKGPNGTSTTRNVLSAAVRDPERRALLVNRKDLMPGDLTTFDDADTLDLLRTRPDVTPKSLRELNQEFAKAYQGTSPVGGAKYAAGASNKEAVALLKERTDLRAGDLSDMVRNLGKASGGNKLPDMFSQASELLTRRKDISPNQLGEMAVTLNKSSGGPKEVPAMFGSAIQTMSERPDIVPKQLGDMAKKMNESVGNQNAAYVPEMFTKANRALAKRPDVNTEQMGQLAQSLGQGGLGSGAKGKDIANAFGKSVDLIADRADIKMESVLGMASQANSDPKIRALPAKRRLEVFSEGLEQMRAGKEGALDLAKDKLVRKPERKEGRPTERRGAQAQAEGAPAPEVRAPAAPK